MSGTAVFLMNMSGHHAKKSFAGAVRHLVRERQVYVRSATALSYLVVRPAHLIAAGGAALMVAGWLGVTTFSHLHKETEISSARERTVRIQQLYEARIEKMQDAIEALKGKLMLDQGAYVGKVDDLRDDYDRLADRQRRLEVFFKQGWMPDRAVESLPDAASAPFDAPKPQSRNQLGLKPVVHRASFCATPFSTRAEAEVPLNDMRQLFEGFEAQQLALAQRIIAFGKRKVAGFRVAMKTLGLDPEKVIAATTLPVDAVGGPLLAVQQGRAPRDGLDRMLLGAHRTLLKAEKLRRAMIRMPIRLPFAKDYRLTSGFGFRRDPFKDVLALHLGVDLKTAYGAPVRATAAGVVTGAEMSVVYGRVVDIRHDNGITTRYAHLSAMDVNIDDRVAAGQVVGRVGTSGRSTGPHLHYETRVNGKPIDPYEFLRVARDVVQEKG